MDRETWCPVIHGVTKGRTRLSDWTEMNGLMVFPIFFNLSLWIMHVDFWIELFDGCRKSILVKIVTKCSLYCGHLRSSPRGIAPNWVHLRTLSQRWRGRMWEGKSASLPLPGVICPVLVSDRAFSLQFWFWILFCRTYSLYKFFSGRQ